MFEIYRKEIDWGGKTLILETARSRARQMAALWPAWAKLLHYVQLLPARQSLARISFPYRKLSGKTFAAGKIPGGFSSVKAGLLNMRHLPAV